MAPPFSCAPARKGAFYVAFLKRLSFRHNGASCGKVDPAFRINDALGKGESIGSDALGLC